MSFVEFAPKILLCFKRSYWRHDFIHDLQAGVTVGIIALPLALAFGIGSGVTPERGLWTAIIAGGLIAILGGSRGQISGPTGAFTVILYDIVIRGGYSALLCAGFYAAILLLLMGIFRLGRLIEYIPFPVVAGFTGGIAVTIALGQMRDFLGISLPLWPADAIERIYLIGSHITEFSGSSLFLGVLTLSSAVLIRSWIPRLPWGIASIIIATLINQWGGLHAETIFSRFGTLPDHFPPIQWHELSKAFDFQTLRHLMPDAITIAILGALESLLSAVVADGMMGSRHRPNMELVAQGLGNIGGLLFGGIPATGAIARTAANIKSGARTPMAGVLHAGTLWVLMVFGSEYASAIPLAAMAAVLMMVAWNMFEWQAVGSLLRSPKTEVLVFSATLLLTIFFDLTVAIEVGMILAAFLFMHRMITLSPIVQRLDRVVEGDDDHSLSTKGMEVYRIQGPFFFGVAFRLLEVLKQVETLPETIVLQLQQVPFIDSTGLTTLENFIRTVHQKKRKVILTGVQPSVMKQIEKFGLHVDGFELPAKR